MMLRSAPMNADTPIAHGPDHGLAEHLRTVATLARRHAPPAMGELASLAGLWHDLGKFRPGFQRYVRQDGSLHVEGRAAVSADKTLIAGGDVFDLFEGGNLAAEGKKSLAIEVTLQPAGTTLTDKDIEAVSASIIAAVKKATGGEIRG